ncbi:hypothetical protein J1614_011492 [Plenodomus biglobosus]|nr:hypothetical protein J1614_011492 [Plenodomus biglobosus]
MLLNRTQKPIYHPHHSTKTGPKKKKNPRLRRPRLLHMVPYHPSYRAVSPPHNALGIPQPGYHPEDYRAVP